MPLWKFVSPLPDSTLPPRIKERKQLAVKILSCLQEAAKTCSEDELARLSGYAHSTVQIALYSLKRVGCVQIVGYSERKPKQVDSILQYPSVEKWLGELKQGDYIKTCKYVFWNYLKFLKKTNSEFTDPEALISAALNANMRELATKHVDLAKQFARARADATEASKKKHYDIVRSFYQHNGVPLPRSPLPRSAADDTEIKAVSIEITPLLHKLKQIVTHKGCSERDRAIILLQAQSGMDDSTLARVFNVLAFPQLVAYFGTADFTQWDKSKCPVRIDLRRPKTGRQFYTFFDIDALEALKEWLAFRRSLTGRDIAVHPIQRADKLKISDPIFVVGPRGERPLRAYMVWKIVHDNAIKSGVMEKYSGKIEKFKGATIRYEIHAHEFRDSLLSLASSMGLRPVAEFFLAHEIDRLHYDKSPYLHAEHYRESYSKFASFLNVLSRDPEKETLRKDNEALKQELEFERVSMREELEKAKQEMKSEIQSALLGILAGSQSALKAEAAARLPPPDPPHNAGI